MDEGTLPAPEDEGRHGQFGDIDYYVEKELDEEETGYQWVVHVKDQGRWELAGGFYYEDEALIAHPTGYQHDLDAHLKALEEMLKPGAEDYGDLRRPVGDEDAAIRHIINVFFFEG
ncbi:MAG: hypothetical protein WEB00_13360 [Dehalococcoidia bacterium]